MSSVKLEEKGIWSQFGTWISFSIPHSLKGPTPLPLENLIWFLLVLTRRGSDVISQMTLSSPIEVQYESSDFCNVISFPDCHVQADSIFPSYSIFIPFPRRWRHWTYPTPSRQFNDFTVKMVDFCPNTLYVNGYQLLPRVARCCQAVASWRESVSSKFLFCFSTLINFFPHSAIVSGEYRLEGSEEGKYRENIASRRPISTVCAKWIIKSVLSIAIKDSLRFMLVGRLNYKMLCDVSVRNDPNSIACKCQS